MNLLRFSNTLQYLDISYNLKRIQKVLILISTPYFSSIHTNYTFIYFLLYETKEIEFFILITTQLRGAFYCILNLSIHVREVWITWFLSMGFVHRKKKFGESNYKAWFRNLKRAYLKFDWVVSVESKKYL